MAHDTVIRLGFFFGVFALIALWEVLAPRRALTTSKAGRWATYFGIIILNPIVVNLVFPLLALPKLLVLPFIGKTGNYPIGRRGTKGSP